VNIACLLLAAGESARFGGCKQLAQIDGVPMLQRSLKTLQPLFAERLYCVLGARSEQLLPLANSYAEVIEHPDWARGMGSSIAAGMHALQAAGEYDGVLIALADQIGLATQDYARLLQALDGERIVAAEYAGRHAVPAIFPRSLFTELATLDGDSGGRNLLRQHAGSLIGVPMPAAQWDVDTPSDLQRTQ
jgi:molybdenum cofactor cytidylyltransferase